MKTDAQLIRQISRSVSARMTPAEFYALGKRRGGVRTHWAGKGQAARRAKRRKGDRAKMP